MTDMSREYAEALFALACEENAKKEYALALDTVSKAFKDAPEYMDLLVCPGIPMAERIAAIDEAFSGRIPGYVVCFLKLLCEKSRISFFSSCVREYHSLLDASEHVSAAKITSAVELTNDEKIRLQKKLEKMSGHSIIMEYVTDPGIMGGILIETDGRVIDGSLRRHLQEVKEVIGR